MINVFIGAGASFDFGIPLVKSFTHDFKSNILKRINTHLFNFNDQVSIKERFIEIIENDDLNYEEMIKELELWMIEESGENYQIIHGLVFQSIEVVHLLLLEIQCKSFLKMTEKFPACSGLKNIINSHGILNIFSLNHDVMIEELCNFHQIAFKDGFSKGVQHNYNSIGSFKVATKKQFEEHSLDFFEKGEVGLNLFKIHGALDIYAIEDKEKYLKVDKTHFAGCLFALKAIEKISLDYCKRTGGSRGVNELFVQDDLGELQFFRRSLLSGGHKFTGRFEQIVPEGIFGEFKIRISDSENLFIIGYGFGDMHVNEVIKSWMLSRVQNKIIICDPTRKCIPEFLLTYKDRVEIRNIGLINFLQNFN